MVSDSKHWIQINTEVFWERVLVCLCHVVPLLISGVLESQLIFDAIKLTIPSPPDEKESRPDAYIRHVESCRILMQCAKKFNISEITTY